MKSLAAEVDPFVGTEGGGNTIPGPSLPFGMIKPGPDVGQNQTNSGWDAHSDINGFSQTHVNGTGGGAKYGNILVQPTTGPEQCANFGSPREQEIASIGYYGVRLKRYDIKAEITAAARAAIYRFTYPKNAQSNLLIDAGHCLSSCGGEGQSVIASSVTVVSPTEVSGSSSVSGGWNMQITPYTVFFYAVTDKQAARWGTWSGKQMNQWQKEEPSAPKTGAWLSFATKGDEVVHLKIGISFVSVAQAKENALNQITGFDFEATKNAAISIWDKTLQAIEIDATPKLRRMFYTSLYHTMLMPVDRTGENPLWDSSEPYYDDFYAIWDTFRTSTPLLTLIDPQRQAAIVRSLVDMYRHEGAMPDARSGNFNGRTQGGSNADIVLADGYVKHLPGIDWGTAYMAVVADAEAPPRDQFKEGRGGLEDWHKLGYVTLEGVDRSGSKQMEYAVDDFAAATLARGLGKKADAETYFKRAGNWQNLWNADFEEAGFKGFIQPRHRDGRWMEGFTAMMGCSWGGKTFYEGNSWTYSFFVPQDMAALIKKCGGNERFVQRLDAFFTGKRRFDVSNEPGFLTPYLYLYANRHDKTAKSVRSILASNFHPTRTGIPGNDDAGAMSSLLAFGVLGYFPVAGQDVYLIGSPQVVSSTLHLANGKTFKVEALNCSPENKYISSAMFNGKPLNQAWFRHCDIVDGGRLVLNMTSTPGAWPTGALPPSPLQAFQHER